MKVVKLYTLVLGLILSLSGCKALDKLDRSHDYQKVAGPEKPLLLPQDIPRDTIEDLYPVPESKSTKSKQKVSGVSTLPPGSTLKKE